MNDPFAAVSLIGLFVGPVILAVAMAVWREWLGERFCHIKHFSFSRHTKGSVFARLRRYR